MSEMRGHGSMQKAAMAARQPLHGSPVGAGTDVWSQVGLGNAMSDVTAFNMTQAQPKVADPSGKIQDQLNKTFVGCRQRERNEPPHITIRTADNRVARIEISNGNVMEGASGDSDTVDIVQKDLKENPNKYIKNWNDNNPDMQIPFIQEKQDELPKKDESYKETEWYKDSQSFSATDEEGAG